MVRAIVAIVISLAFFTFIFTMAINVAHDGKFEMEGEVGKYNSGNLVNVRDVKDGVASLSIDGNNVLMREGEVYEFKDVGIGFAGKPDYSGTVTVKSMNERVVITEANVNKTKYFYLYKGALTALFSLLLATFILIKPKRVRSETSGD